MTKHTFKAQSRNLTGRKVKNLRKQGLIPASLFGKTIKSQNLALPAKEFSKKYAEVGESGLVYLTVDNNKTETPVIFSEVTVHPVTGDTMHVSLRQVNLTEKITAPVKVELTGKSQAVTDGLGVLVQQTDEIEIEALPQDFPENITVDISGLANLDAAITVKDLNLSSKLEVKTDPQAIIVKINPLAKEEVVEAPVAETPEGAAPAGETSPAPETKTPPETK